MAPTLRGMKVGDEEVFPITQYPVVRNATYRDLAKERMEGWRFSHKVDYDNGTYTITRVS